MKNKMKKDMERVEKKFKINSSKKISQGAEAIILESNDKIIKYRLPKNYRIKKIDNKLRKSRTKREFKVLKKLRKKINVPKIHEKSKYVIIMDKIKGKKVSSIKKIDDYTLKRIGSNMAKMHKSEIMHGDLTTSNMILDNKKVYFIDFGLSKFSRKIEDYAVDIHLLNRALESKHFENFPENFEKIINQYKKEYKKSKEVLKRLKIVENRGRYKKN